MGILCLTGCNNEDPQRVEFSMHEHKVPRYGEVCSVTIKANCPWTISEDSREVLIVEMEGTGDEYVRINIAENLVYEDLVHRIVVTSEDGTCSDELIILQESRKDIFVDKNGIATDNNGMIAAEGGTFLVPVETNDEIASVNTPEWITLVSSRSFTDKTYSFAVNPNKTGSVRTGTIFFKGVSTTSSIDIVQDSYTPSKIIIEDFPVVSDTSYVECKVIIEPEYADWSKVKLESDKDGTISFTWDHILKMKLGPGQNYVTFKIGDKQFFNWTTMYFPEIEFTPRLASCFLTTVLSKNTYLAHFDAHISDYPYLSIKHYYLIDKNGKVLLKDEGKIWFDKGMNYIETDALRFSCENYKEEIKGITFKVELEYSYGEEYLGSNILQKEVAVPSDW